MCITAVPRGIENNAYAKFWGANKVHYGTRGSGLLTLFVRGYSFQLYCLGNSFVQNFTALQFQNDTWW